MLSSIQLLLVFVGILVCPNCVLKLFLFFAISSSFSFWNLKGRKLGQTNGRRRLYLPSTGTKNCLESCTSEEKQSRTKKMTNNNAQKRLLSLDRNIHSPHWLRIIICNYAYFSDHLPADRVFKIRNGYYKNKRRIRTMKYLFILYFIRP